jgi:hypothetical protein
MSGYLAAAAGCRLAAASTQGAKVLVDPERCPDMRTSLRSFFTMLDVGSKSAYCCSLRL